MIYQVLKPCVIEGEYYKKGDEYNPSWHMSKAALDELIKHNFLVYFIPEKQDIKVRLSAKIVRTLQAWINLNEGIEDKIAISRYTMPFRGQADGYIYQFRVYPPADFCFAVSCCFEFSSRTPIPALEAALTDVTTSTSYKLYELGLVWNPLDDDAEHHPY